MDKLKAFEIDAQGFLSTVKILHSPNFDKRPNPNDIRLIVIHGISLPPGRFGGGHIEKFFLNQTHPGIHPFLDQLATVRVSSHLLVSRIGQVTQFVSFKDRAWHAGTSSFHNIPNCNDYSIGIELEGTDATPYTVRQYQALAALVGALCEAYKIPHSHIVGHNDIAPGRKTDPGVAFSWDYFHQQINKGEQDGYAVCLNCRNDFNAV